MQELDNGQIIKRCQDLSVLGVYVSKVIDFGFIEFIELMGFGFIGLSVLRLRKF